MTEAHGNTIDILESQGCLEVATNVCKLTDQFVAYHVSIYTYTEYRYCAFSSSIMTVYYLVMYSTGIVPIQLTMQKYGYFTKTPNKGQPPNSGH